MIPDLTPGRVVEFRGELYLIETMEVTIQMQHIAPMAPIIERQIATDWAEPYSISPIIQRVQGKYGDPESPIAELIPLYKEEDL